MSNGESPTYAASSGVGAEPLEREQERRRVRLVLGRLVAADDGLEEVLDRDAVEREVDGHAALGGDDAEAVPRSRSSSSTTSMPSQTAIVSCSGSLCAR